MWLFLYNLGFDYKKQFYQAFIKEDGTKAYAAQIPHGVKYGEVIREHSFTDKYLVKRTFSEKAKINFHRLRQHLTYTSTGTSQKDRNNAIKILKTTDKVELKKYAQYQSKERKILGSPRKENTNIFIIDGDNKQNLSYEHGLKALHKSLTLVQQQYNITPVFTEISPRGTFHIYYHAKLDHKKLMEYLNSETDERINIEILSPNQNFRFPLSHDYYPIKHDKFLQCDLEDFWNLPSALYESFQDFFQSVNLSPQVATTPIIKIEETPDNTPRTILPIYVNNTPGKITAQWIMQNEDLDITEGNRFRNQARIFAYAKHAGINDHEDIIDLCEMKLLSSKDVEKYGRDWWRDKLREAFKSLEKGFVPGKQQSTLSEFISSCHILNEEDSKSLDCIISEYISKETLKYYPDLPIVLKECLCKIIYEFQNKKEINSQHKGLLNKNMIKGIEELPDLPCIFFDRMKKHYNLKADGYTYRNLILTPARKMEAECGVLSLRLFERFNISSKTSWVNAKDWGYTQRLTSSFTFKEGMTVSECVEKIVNVLISKVYKKYRELASRDQRSWPLFKPKSLYYILRGGEEVSAKEELWRILLRDFDPLPSS